MFDVGLLTSCEGGTGGIRERAHSHRGLLSGGLGPPAPRAADLPSPCVLPSSENLVTEKTTVVHRLGFKLAVRQEPQKNVMDRLGRGRQDR